MGPFFVCIPTLRAVARGGGWGCFCHAMSHGGPSRRRCSSVVFVVMINQNL